MRLRMWTAEQRRVGREDARAGRPSSMSDEGYLQGYSEGSSPCRCATSVAHPAGCQRQPATKKYGLCRFCQAGHNE